MAIIRKMVSAMQEGMQNKAIRETAIHLKRVGEYRSESVEGIEKILRDRMKNG